LRCGRPLVTLSQLTVRVVVPVTPFMVALMVVVPVPVLLANPSSLMVATPTAEEVQVT
jgi:hypothetical protein